MLLYCYFSRQFPIISLCRTKLSPVLEEGESVEDKLNKTTVIDPDTGLPIEVKQEPAGSQNPAEDAGLPKTPPETTPPNNENATPKKTEKEDRKRAALLELTKVFDILLRVEKRTTDITTGVRSKALKAVADCLLLLTPEDQARSLLPQPGKPEPMVNVSKLFAMHMYEEKPLSKRVGVILYAT